MSIDQAKTEVVAELARSLLEHEASQVRDALSAICCRLEREVIMETCRRLVADQTAIYDINAGQIVCYRNGPEYIAHRTAKRTSNYVYLTDHRCVEVVLATPPGGARVARYTVADVDDDVFQLRKDFDAMALQPASVEEVKPGDVLVKRAPGEIYDLHHEGPIVSMKFVRLSPMPYEFLFERGHGRFVGVLQSTYQPGLMQTAIEILHRTTPFGAEGELVEAVKARDPTTAWAALRVLDAMGHESAPEFLASFEVSPVPLLSKAARAAKISAGV